MSFTLNTKPSQRKALQFKCMLDQRRNYDVRVLPYLEHIIMPPSALWKVYVKGESARTRRSAIVRTRDPYTYSVIARHTATALDPIRLQ